MITEMKDWLLSHDLNSTLVILTYWIPMLICAIVYTVRVIEMYKKDIEGVKNEPQQGYYTPELTIGYIVGHIFYTFTPCVNLFATVFDCSSAIVTRLGKILDIPLVKPNKRHQYPEKK